MTSCAPKKWLINSLCFVFLLYMLLKVFYLVDNGGVEVMIMPVQEIEGICPS